MLNINAECLHYAGQNALTISLSIFLILSFIPYFSAIFSIFLAIFSESYTLLSVQNFIKYSWAPCVIIVSKIKTSLNGIL